VGVFVVSLYRSGIFLVSIFWWGWVEWSGEIKKCCERTREYIFLGYIVHTLDGRNERRIAFYYLF